MNKKLYTAPTVATIDILPCQLMAGSGGKGSVTEDSNNPGGVDVTMPDGVGDTDQADFMSLDDPHLWY